MKILTFYLLLSFAFCTSCLKTGNITRNATGKITDSTTNTPISNTSFEMIVLQYNSQNLMSTAMETKYTFATDSGGNFNISFQAKTGASMGITFPGGSVKGNTKVIWAADVKDQDNYPLGELHTKKI